jgi:hypothetical protein
VLDASDVAASARRFFAALLRALTVCCVSAASAGFSFSRFSVFRFFQFSRFLVVETSTAVSRRRGSGYSGCTNCHFLQPQRSKLKLRKELHLLGITDLVLCLDFDPRQGEWRLCIRAFPSYRAIALNLFHCHSVFTNWKHRVIGGDINMAGTASEISLSRDFQVRCRA